jgi:hypothetical protein
MLPAAAAEFLQLQPIRCGLPVLSLRVIPLFALAALQRNDLSGHGSLLRMKKEEVKMQNPCSLHRLTFRLLLHSSF